MGHNFHIFKDFLPFSIPEKRCPVTNDFNFTWLYRDNFLSDNLPVRHFSHRLCLLLFTTQTPSEECLDIDKYVVLSYRSRLQWNVLFPFSSMTRLLGRQHFSWSPNLWRNDTGRTSLRFVSALEYHSPLVFDMWELFDTIQTPFYVYAFEAEKGRLERVEKNKNPEKCSCGINARQRPMVVLKN